ncbi:E3 ubiquitin-protein ligase TRIM39-like [Latimeria chalumnae]|uniref:E3 ubiquitin-protein ligase TRIM39-like n=1 Tax=Latimeria chalumnae TaxID=7897 RepID=UPI00313DF61A
MDASNETSRASTIKGIARGRSCRRHFSHFRHSRCRRRNGYQRERIRTKGELLIPIELKALVSSATHECGHMLDLVSSKGVVISDCLLNPIAWSDHYLMALGCLALRIKEYADYKPREPEAVSAADIDGYKYTDRLQYRVWKKMLKIINRETVTLDPNTAHPKLTLSEDLMAVAWGSTRRDDLPDNPERFDTCACVLGSEGFTSGRHSWVVDVGNKTSWDLGVARESINRKGDITLSPKHGYWTLVLRNGGEYNAGTNGWIQLELEKSPKKVLVCVDYEAGKVSFSNADDMSHIYTFTDNFTEKIFPYFYPGNISGGKNGEPLRIHPL